MVPRTDGVWPARAGGEEHPRRRSQPSEFKRRTGCGVLINTSFNIRGEPIVGSPQDALRCFLGTDMDVLVLEDCLLHKERQPAIPRAEQEKYAHGFAPD